MADKRGLGGAGKANRLPMLLAGRGLLDEREIKHRG
jgi:hypothetical protein